ncbi:MAG: hypothetical protein MRY83_24915 [Flavobacteriales bacterium]|nr:hypothetical protein [Flavobacteriales bacterium]
MKKLSIILGIGAALTFGACKKEKNVSSEVIRDCTGTYLRLDEKDYKVCNIDILEGYESETNIIATFKKTNNCDDPEVAVCLLYHPFEHYIKIQSIQEFELQAK